MAAEAIPDTQKAWLIVRKGVPAKALRLEEYPVPKKLRKGEVLVRVQAAALNPVYVALSHTHLTRSLKDYTCVQRLRDDGPPAQLPRPAAACRGARLYGRCRRRERHRAAGGTRGLRVDSTPYVFSLPSASFHPHFRVRQPPKFPANKVRSVNTRACPRIFFCPSLRTSRRLRQRGSALRVRQRTVRSSATRSSNLVRACLSTAGAPPWASLRYNWLKHLDVPLAQVPRGRRKSS